MVSALRSSLNYQKLCSVLGRNTLLSHCLFVSRCMNGCGEFNAGDNPTMV